MYAGSDDGSLYAWLADGSDVVDGFPIAVGAPVNSPAVDVENELVYVTTNAGELKVFDARNANPHKKNTWMQVPLGMPTEGPPGLTDPTLTHPPTQPSQPSQRVYFGSSDGNVYAYETKTGQPPAGWPAQTGGAVYSAPAVDRDGNVYVGSNDGMLWSFYPNGGQHWPPFPLSNGATPTSVYSSPAVADGVVFICTGDSKMAYAVDAAAGTQNWASGLGKEVFGSPAVAHGGKTGTVYIATHDGTLHALQAATGAPPQGWTSPMAGGTGSSAAVADGVVYLGSDDGNLYAYDAVTGADLWQYPIGPPGTVPGHPSAPIGVHSPVVASGTVYVGAGGANDPNIGFTAGGVYAFRLPPQT